MHTFISGSLPPLAWGLIRTYYDRYKDIAYIGRKVRSIGSTFFEGGYTGTCPEDDDNIFMGSGFRNDGGSLTIFSPTHVADQCVIINDKRSQHFVASNSLFFALALAGMDDEYLKFDFEMIFRGLNKPDFQIYHSEDYDVYLLCAARAILENNTITFRSDIRQYNFINYDSYHSFLKNTLLQLYSSFIPSGITVYLSRGYDSNACAALAYEVFPQKKRQALTMFLGRTNERDDSFHLASKYGMDAYMIDGVCADNTYQSNPWDRYRGKKKDFSFYSLFASPVTGECEHTNWVNPALLENQMVLSGWHGDCLWNYRERNADMNRVDHRDFSGCGLQEFRLTCGYMYVPVPAIAFTAWDSLSEIAQSVEMAPWRLGEQPEYDRPIPRRMVEELTPVRRGEFATKKNMIAGYANFYDEDGKKLPIKNIFDVRLSYYKNLLQVLRYESEISPEGGGGGVFLFPHRMMSSRSIYLPKFTMIQENWNLAGCVKYFGCALSLIDQCVVYKSSAIT